MEEKVTNAFNKHPIVFDDACDLPATVQRVFTRLYSRLWGNNANSWQGSYPKLAQLTKLSVGTVYEARRLLVEAGLITVEEVPNKGNTDTLLIRVTPDRLWELNKRYCALHLDERDAFCQQHAWKTLDELQENLSKFEKQRVSLSKPEKRLSINERRQAQEFSNNERQPSNFERRHPTESSSQAASDVPTDITDNTNKDTDESSFSSSKKLPTVVPPWLRKGITEITKIYGEGEQTKTYEERVFPYYRGAREKMNTSDAREIFEQAISEGKNMGMEHLFIYLDNRLKHLISEEVTN